MRANFPTRIVVMCLATLGAAGSGLAQVVPPLRDILPALRGTTAGSILVLVPSAPAVQTPPINYGRPKKPVKLLPKRLGPAIGRPLPALQPYRTAPGQRRGDATGTIPGPTVAAIAVLPSPRRRVVDPRPFDPVGLSVGSLRLTPYIESSLGFDSNPNRINRNAKSTLFVRGEAGATLQSDWSVHEFDATLRGGYSDYFSQRDASRPNANLVTNARIDASRNTALDFQSRFALDSQRAGTTGLLAGANLASRPLTYAYGASAGVTQKLNRVTVLLRGSLDRNTFDNASLVGGTVLNLTSQDYNTYGLRGRIAYEVTPGVSPFVEVVGDQRRYDQRLDATGFARSSNGLTGRAGTSFEVSRILTGEVSAGYSRRTYEDPRLRTLAGPTLDAALVWTASPLTTVTLRAVTNLAESGVANSSGILTRNLSLGVSHALFRNFTLTGVATYQKSDYQGLPQRDTLYSLGLKADYNLTRSIVIRSSFTHDRLKSSVPGADYTANTVLLGLRLQR